MIKRIFKKITPPIISDLLRSMKKPPSYTPSWHELQYQPLKGVRVFFDAKGPWQKKIISGSYDEFLWNDISSLNLHGKTIFDIGSHIGFHSLYFSRLVGESGKIFAFEPNPYNIKRIEEIIEGNEKIKNIKLLPLALGDATKKRNIPHECRYRKRQKFRRFYREGGHDLGKRSFYKSRFLRTRSRHGYH